tara:strand:- start:474 stop:647 length:174 start_codon:yes stop_codon:yes gene_type:complete
MIELINGIDIMLPYIEWFWKRMFDIGIIGMACVVSYNLNKELHRDIFKRKIVIKGER